MKRLFSFFLYFIFYWATLGLAVLLVAGAGVGLVMVLAYWQGWVLVPLPDWMQLVGALALTGAAGWIAWGEVQAED